MRRPAAALCLALTFATAAGASPAERERLIDLYQITASQELCDFPLNDKQAGFLAEETDKLERRLGMDDDQAQKLYDQIETQMTAQKAAGLCNADGAWARTYTQLVEKLGR